MHDMIDGKYRLPWERAVKITDGMSCGFSAPMRTYKESLGSLHQSA
jgi:formamidase